MIDAPTPRSSHKTQGRDLTSRPWHKTAPGRLILPEPGVPWTWQQRLSHYLATRHRASLDDVEPTSTPGYWRYKRPCTGCVHPLDGHFPTGCGITHTVSYFDAKDRDAQGRWLSPYRTWREAVAAHGTDEREG